MAKHKKRSDGSKGDYEVGYGRPPTHSQFQPGTSGNPKGRPKKRPTLAELVAKEGQKTIRVTEGGKERRITKFEYVVAAQFLKAGKGDHKALEFLERASGQISDGEVSPETDVSQEDAELLRRLDERRRGGRDHA